MLEGGAGSLLDGDMAAAALVEGVAGSVLEAMGEEPSIARLRGLPWSYGCKEVCEFLAGTSPSLSHLSPEAVTMLHNAAGEAFVTLTSAPLLADVLQANHQQIGRRYVEVFSSTAAAPQGQLRVRQHADIRVPGEVAWRRWRHSSCARRRRRRRWRG